MIFFRPIADRNTASSRLRVWNIQPHIEDSAVAIADKYKKGDILIIQKAPDINELRKAKSQGAKVIYDIDDKYETENFIEMIREADIVTCDTDIKKEWLSKFNEKVEVIPDSLDWDGTIKTDYKDKDLVIGWTGYGNNSQYLNPVIEKLPIPIRLIVTPDWIQYINQPATNVQSRPWSLEMVDKYLAECDLGMYYLPDGDFEQCKGMHKLLKNWAIGLPTYVSPMPDYLKAIKEAGVSDKCVVKKLEDWAKIKPLKFDEKCRKYALKYEAKEIAKLWKKLISQLSTPISDKKNA